MSTTTMPQSTQNPKTITLFIQQKSLSKRQKCNTPELNQTAMTIELDNELSSKLTNSTDLDTNIKTETITLSTQDLLTAIVRKQVNDFNQRIAQQNELKQNSKPQPLGTALIDDYLHSVGKVDFDTMTNLTPADSDKALQTALQAFLDGLFVLFIDDEEVQSLSQMVSIYDGCQLSFVRLTFLAGGLF